jgi:hypothetical protein
MKFAQQNREDAAILEIAKRLQEPWYSDTQGCLTMAHRILALEGKDWQIKVVRRKEVTNGK